MHAERVFLETDDRGFLKEVPKLPPRCKVEAIFLVISEPPAKRRPATGLANRMELTDDLIVPAVDEGDWNL